MTAFNFTGKTALITGAAAGLGKAISSAFFSAGANVILVDVNEPLLRETYTELTSSEAGSQKRAIHITADISNEESVAKLWSTAIRTFQRVDILVNNAGIMDRFDPVGQVEKSLWDRVIAVNVTGPMLMTKAFVNAAEGRKEGVILNVASTAAIKGFVAGAAYTTSKHALLGLTKNTAAFYAKRGLRCNAILPGGMQTDISSAFANGMNQEGYNTVQLSVAMEPPVCSLDRMAKLVLYICSEEGELLNGACINADHGWTAY